tara:strand:- start:141 stop:338 length:198 start_codon:yes stop_codon:yes gene_type:complete
MGTDYEDLRQRLEGIAEELADLALDRLRAGVEGDVDAVGDERRLTRARRAVEKASYLLSDGERGS